MSICPVLTRRTIIAFVPEGDIDPPTLHMKYPGTISLTEDTYRRLLTEVCACFRAHGFEQIVYAKDGEPLDQPYAADTILVGPGERYTVLFNADQVGTWVWHCHILNHAESADGMFGMVTAVVVQ